MFARVKLIQIRGSEPGREHTFYSPTPCVIGRSADCTIRVDPTQGNADISRHHCRLEIAPPSVRVCDLRSLNGTYVNGRRVGKRDSSLAPRASSPADGTEIVLSDGDELRLGAVTTYRVHIRAASTRHEGAALHFDQERTFVESPV